jgi:peptidoglycan/LPS O-acetylase OafA/YrhL
MTASGAVTTEAPRRTTAGRTLGTALDGPDNALNAIRLMLALLVIVAHTVAIADTSWAPWIGGLGGWAVAGFFVISGYLIAGSRLRSSWWSYSIRRLARIFPGYWVQLLAVALVFAPLATLLGPSTWTPGAAASYVAQNLTTFDLQYTFEGSAFPRFDAWNGSAWTLMYELLAYLGCLIVFSIPWCRRHMAAVSAVALVALTAFNVLAPLLDVTTNLYLHTAHLGSYFAAGMLAYALRDRIPARWSLITCAALISIVLLALPDGDEVAQIPVAYALLAAGAASRVRLGSTNDISYGVYIYAFPVQQVVAMAGLAGLLHLAVSTGVTLLIAFASWRLVEKPAMNGARDLIRWCRRSR